MQEEKKVPNKNGRKGSKEHQDKIKEVAQQLEKKNFYVLFERYFKLKFAKKRGRFVDIAAFNKETGKLEEIHQIGINNKKGEPVKREAEAIADLKKEYPYKTFFHTYKTLLIVLIVIVTLGIYTINTLI